MNIVSLLEQNVFWRMAGGVKIRLTEMDPTHRANTLAFLRRRAAYQHKLYLMTEFSYMESAPDDVYEQYVMDGGLALGDDPEAWLERRPLVIELARLVRQDEAVDGEVVPERLEITDGQKHLQ